jgi:hypothetical protein
MINGSMENTITEDRKGLTSNDLAEKTKQILKTSKPSADQILKKYLYPLINQGIIDKIDSRINKNNKLYFPSDEEQNIFSLFTNNNNDYRLRVRDETFYPSKDVVLQSLKSISIEENHHAEDTPSKNQVYHLQDHEGKEIAIEQLVERYLSNPELCFIEV